MLWQVIARQSSSNHDFLRSSRKGTAMHKVYYNTMHRDPDKLFINISDALERIKSEEKTLIWAQEFNILGKHDKYKALHLEDAMTTQTGWGIQKNSEYRDGQKYGPWVA